MEEKHQQEDKEEQEKYELHVVMLHAGISCCLIKIYLLRSACIYINPLSYITQLKSRDWHHCKIAAARIKINSSMYFYLFL